MTTSVQLLETMIDQGAMNASDITEALANIGRGSMGQGIKEIMDQCKSLGYSNGYKLGIREGAHNAFQEFLSYDRKRIAATCVLCFAAGALVTAGGFWLHNKIADSKKVRENTSGIDADSEQDDDANQYSC